MPPRTIESCGCEDRTPSKKIETQNEQYTINGVFSFRRDPGFDIEEIHFRIQPDYLASPATYVRYIDEETGDMYVQCACETNYGFQTTMLVHFTRKLVEETPRLMEMSNMVVRRNYGHCQIVPYTNDFVPKFLRGKEDPWKGMLTAESEHVRSQRGVLRKMLGRSKLDTCYTKQMDTSPYRFFFRMRRKNRR